jgi:3'-phosphoadenosine 5'-phosphosulfate sulfotransferase (PAPS reductase)/FAD synthetase
MERLKIILDAAALVINAAAAPAVAAAIASPHLQIVQAHILDLRAPFLRPGYRCCGAGGGQTVTIRTALNDHDFHVFLRGLRDRDSGTRRSRNRRKARKGDGLFRAFRVLPLFSVFRIFSGVFITFSRTAR